MPNDHVDPCPECSQGKHLNCDRTTWDDTADQRTTCPCWQMDPDRHTLRVVHD